MEPRCQTRSEMTRYSGHMLAVLAPFVLQGLAPTRCMKVLLGLLSPELPFFSAKPLYQQKGSGACPPSFQCPKGTVTPWPTPKGFHTEHPGYNQVHRLFAWFLRADSRQSKLRHVTNALLGHLARLKAYLWPRNAVGQACINRLTMMAATVVYHVPKARGQRIGD
jgi:hypothetical protein